MLKLITSRYAGSCKKCRARFSRGDRIYWSKPTGAICVTCGRNENERNSRNVPPISETKSPESKPTPVPIPSQGISPVETIDRDHRFTVDFAEVKDLVREGLTGTVTRKLRAANRSQVLQHSHDISSWHGYTDGQLSRWINEGYRSDAIKGLSEFTPPLRDKRRLIYSEEGDEFHLDLAQSGVENYMSEWTKREVIPGVAIIAEIAFSAAVNAEIVNAYNSWLCRVAYSLEAAGIDCEISLKYTAKWLFGHDSNQSRQTIIRVKKENEALDYTSWSSMLSPAAFRTFIFVANALHAESKGTDVSSGQGANSSARWGVTWNGERRTLEISSEWSPRDRFPEEMMDAQLREALREMSGKKKSA